GGDQVRLHVGVPPKARILLQLALPALPVHGRQAGVGVDPDPRARAEAADQQRLMALRWSIALAVTLGLAGAARAAEPPPATAEERFHHAEQALAGGRFAEALAGYQEAIAADPSARFAGAARARAADLEAHAEGGFAPLAALEAVRRDPRKSGEREAIEALERAISSFPEGRVRSEAALVVAEAWWHRLGEPRRAIAPLTFAVEDAAADRLTRSLALAEIAAVRRELGELGEARDLVERYPDLSPGTRAEVRRLIRRAELR